MTTGSGGSYSFTNMIPGTYTVQFAAPSGYLFDGSSHEMSGLNSGTHGQRDPKRGRVFVFVGVFGVGCGVGGRGRRRRRVQVRTACQV